MAALEGVVSWIFALGAPTFLPVIIMLVGLVFGMKWDRALRAGFLIGIGFRGITLVLSILTGSLSPVAQAMARDTGANLDVIDCGWEMTSTAAWATPYSAIVVPLGILLNVILLRLRVTKTLNVDIWNYWHFLFSSTLAYVVTGSFLWGLLIALLSSVATLLIADWLAPIWQEYFDLYGTSCTTMGNIASSGVMSWLFGNLVDKIPGIDKVQISPEGIQKQFGTLGEPMFVGAIVGFLIALAGRQPLDKSLQTATAMAATLVLLPRMVQLLMEGLRPIALSAQEWAKQHLGDRPILLGMDVALGLGDPVGISAVIIMIPIKLILALTLPGNRWLPLASLASPYATPFPAAFGKGNLFRAVLITSLIQVVTMYLGTWFCAESTAAVAWAGFPVEEGVKLGGAGGLHYAVIILLSRLVAPILGGTPLV